MGKTYINKQKNLTELIGEWEPQENKGKVEHNSVNRIKGMRKKTDLSDIILEKENSTSDRNKKIILSAASLVLLFLIFLIFSKFINSDVLTEQIQVVNKKDNKQEKVAIKDKAKAIINTSENIEKDEEKISDKTKDVKDTDLKFEEMVKKLREEEAKENNVEMEEIATQSKSEEDSVKPKMIEKPTIKTTNESKPKKEQKVVIARVKEESKEKAPIKATKTKIDKPKKNIIFSKHSGYYIQVGATTSPNPNRFLVAKIKQNGYPYITHPIVVKGKRFYKVLIGPYDSKIQALNKLSKIKTTINPQAFLYHLR
jgi:DedD protein